MRSGSDTDIDSSNERTFVEQDLPKKFGRTHSHRFSGAGEIFLFNLIFQPLFV